MTDDESTPHTTMTVLFVDDEQIVLDSARKLLRKDDVRLEVALDAAQGLASLERGGIDIVLTDLMMPGMDGLELLKTIKERWPAIPVVMVTGYATISTAMQAMKLGAFDYIAKPFTRAELRGVVRRASHLAAEMGGPPPSGPEDVATGEQDSGPRRSSVLRTLGHNSWMMMLEDGSVQIGVEEAFVRGIGVIQEIDLPTPGDRLAQGAVCLQIFSADLRTHVVWSPLSGQVVEVNPRLRQDPTAALQDPYDQGWLLRIKPSNFEAERQVLGL